MTGYESKKAAARDKLEDDDTQVYQAWKESASDYERGFIDGMQKQMQSSVDKAVNRMAQPVQEPVPWAGVDFDINTTPPQRPWVGLTDDEVYKIAFALEGEHWRKIADAIEAKLKEKNNAA
jgi:hypothetical protein